MACVLFALVVVGCDVGPLADLDPGNATVMADKAPKLVPVKGKAIFRADLTAVPPVLDCGYGEVFFHRFDAEGVLSHVGSVANVIDIDECWINLGDGTLGVKGRFTITAANGDQLLGDWAGKMYGPNPDGGPNLWDFYAYDAAHPVQYTGGTGRFDGASGFAAGGGTFDRTTQTGTYRLDGLISSVGSLK
jgi:hypothetical protein